MKPREAESTSPRDRRLLPSAQRSATRVLPRSSCLPSFPHFARPLYAHKHSLEVDSSNHTTRRIGEQDVLPKIGVRHGTTMMEVWIRSVAQVLYGCRGVYVCFANSSCHSTPLELVCAVYASSSKVSVGAACKPRIDAAASTNVAG